MDPNRIAAALATTWPVPLFERCPIRTELWLHALALVELDPGLLAAAMRLLDLVQTRDRS